MALSASPLRYRGKPGLAAFLGLLSIALGACHHSNLPKCVEGKEAPTNAQKTLWSSVSKTTEIDLGIDGSGSMLGLMGSDQSIDNWKALVQGITLAAAEEGLTINAQRVGGGKLQTISNPNQAINACFFKGCGPYPPVTSSLSSLWKTKDVITKKNIPIKMLVSDLEVNDGDISNLIEQIKPYVNEGAVIGVLAFRAPFDGKVFNSRASMFHHGEAKRPIYILATGPQSQLHSLLQSIKNKAKLNGVSGTSLKLVRLENWVNQKTLTAKSISGNPAKELASGLPIRLGISTYSPSGSYEYQFAKTTENLKSIQIGSNNTIGQQAAPTISIGTLQAIALPGFTADLNGVNTDGISINGSNLNIKINTPDISSGKALRAVVPRGQLPQDWWIQWDRKSTKSETPQNQTDGLLQLMTSLGKLLVDRTTTPAASFCLLTSS